MAFFFPAFNISLLSVLLARAFYRGHLSAYPLFFSYVAYCVLIGTIQLATLMLGFGVRESPEYRVIYNVTNLPIPIFQLALLVWVYRLVAKRRFWYTVIGGTLIVGLVTTPVISTFGQMRGAPFFLFQASFSVVLLTVCVLIFQALITNSGFDIGTNTRSILFGITLLAVVQSSNFLSIFIGTIGYGLFQVLGAVCYTLSFCVFTYGLWEYDPPSEVPERAFQGTIHERLRRLARSALTLMFR